MTQNFIYLNSSLSKGKLVDIIPGKNKRVVFVWERSKEINQLYKIWCDTTKKEDSYEQN